MSDTIKVTLFPEMEEIKNLTKNSEFLKECLDYIKNLGYSTLMINDQICIILNGENSCHPGTLVGWKYVNDIESFIKPRVSEWYFSNERTQTDVSRIYTATSDIAGQISKILLNEKK
jgi:hypothetical protein